MTNAPDLTKLARNSRAFAARLDMEGAQNIARVAAWELPPTSSSDGPRAKGSHSDPVEAAAVLPASLYKRDPNNPDDNPGHPNRPDPSSEVHSKLLASLRAVETAIDWANRMLTESRAASPKAGREEANDLEAVNSRYGQCAIHIEAGVEARWHTGQRGDTLNNVTVEASQTRLMCDACRKDWERRPYSGLGDGLYQNFVDWMRERTTKLRGSVAA